MRSAAFSASLRFYDEDSADEGDAASFDDVDTDGMVAVMAIKYMQQY